MRSQENTDSSTGTKDRNPLRIFVVGGGPAGMLASIEAAKAGAEVTLLEKNPRVGRKLSQTGNGRCNYTNLSMTGREYRGMHPEFAETANAVFPPEKLIAYFERLGIMPKYRGTYVYPNSDQASSMVYCLLHEMEHLGIRILYDTAVREIKLCTGNAYDRMHFSVMTEKDCFRCDRVILTAGSKAAPVTGSDGDGYLFAKAFGHRIIPVVPALTAIRCAGRYYKELAGVRTDAVLKLQVDGHTEETERGELQLTDYGISGIPVFQLSRYASYALKDGKKVTVQINFLPECKETEVFGLLRERRKNLYYKTAEDFLTGFLNNKLSSVLLKLAGIQLKETAGRIKDEKLRQLAAVMTDYTAEALSVNPFPNAQCAAGGADTVEIDPHTMESRIVKGLYFAGELLDIDGICGGYNLQFAFSSGYIAGRSAGGRKETV